MESRWIASHTQQTGKGPTRKAEKGPRWTKNGNRSIKETRSRSAWPTHVQMQVLLLQTTVPWQRQPSINSRLKIAVITHFLSNPYLFPGRLDKYQSTWGIILLSLQQVLLLGNRTLSSIQILIFTLLMRVSLYITKNHLSHLNKKKAQNQTKKLQPKKNK